VGHMRRSGKGSEVLHCLFSGHVLVWPEVPQITHLLMRLVGGGLVSSSSDSLPLSPSASVMVSSWRGVDGNGHTRSSVPGLQNSRLSR